MVMVETVPSFNGPAGLKLFVALSTVVLTVLLPELAPPPLQIGPAPLFSQTWPTVMVLTVELPPAALISAMA
jgi:hypothetical protein